MRRVQDINTFEGKSKAEDVIFVLASLSRSWNELEEQGEQMPTVMPKASPPAAVTGFQCAWPIRTTRQQPAAEQRDIDRGLIAVYSLYQRP